MLIPTISFDVHNFTTHQTESFLVEATEDNYELIAQQRFTRNIVISQMFDFQFARERKAPKFLEFGNAILGSFAKYTEIENELCDIDEMMGIY